MLTVLISGAGGTIANNMIRALNMSSLNVRTVGVEANPYYKYLSTSDIVYEVPRASDDPYPDALDEIARSEGVDLILPSNGWEVKSIAKNLDSLSAATILPSSATIELMQDKWKLYEQLSNSDVPVPKTILLQSPKDVDQGLGTIETPDYWVRGTGIKDVPGRKTQSEQLIIEWINDIGGWGEFTMSSHLSGQDLTWLGIFDGGKLITSQARQRLAYGQSTSWGVGAPSISVTIQRDDVNTIGEAAIRTIDDCPHGVYFTDMREDDQGTPHVTEINPGRFGTTSSRFYPEADFNVVDVLVRVALDYPIQDMPRYDVIESGTHFINKCGVDPVILTKENIQYES